LVAALAKAQLKFEGVKKDAENPAYSRGTRKSMYATLDSTVRATRAALAENGLVIIAVPHEMVDDRRLKITSLLIHESEQFVESTMIMTAVEKVSPQELGKLITYARRYQWGALTGTAPEDDSDANEASGTGSKEAAQAVAETKIADLKAKKAERGAIQDYEAALFYVHIPQNNMYEISGADSLKKLNRDLLERHYSKVAQAILVNEEQLNTLQFELERRNTPFHKLASK
jgi:hypothetical protein